MKLLKTIRADRSDSAVFQKAADPGEWAVPGVFAFADLDPTLLDGKTRAAYRSGFLGIRSLGWSTLVNIVEASEEERAAAIDLLAKQLFDHFGAPDLEIARRAAEEELDFAASLTDHPLGFLVAVSRRCEDGVTCETFRTLSPRRSSGPIVISMQPNGEDP